MSSSLLLSIATFIYLAAAVLYLMHWIFRWEKLGYAATAVCISGFTIHSLGFVLRWWESHKLGYGHIPLSNLYESLIFFGWATILVYLFLEFKTKKRIIGAFATPFAFLAMAYASFATDSDIEPLIPALQSNWLTVHVITCFLGYAAFAVACGLGIMYLFRHHAEKTRGHQIKEGLWAHLPELHTLDDLIYKTILFGFFWLTVGIITGSVWAEQAWGSYWSWDPKETWSLITWFVYATAIHARLVRGWAGRRIAILSILGFLSVIFTYFGVNFLLAGLHSYASG